MRNHTRAIIHILSKNSQIKSHIIQEIHSFKNAFFTKITYSKSQISQKSHFQNHNFHKNHIFKIAIFTKITFSKSQFSQKSDFQKTKFSQISHFSENSHYFKYQLQVNFLTKNEILPQCA